MSNVKILGLSIRNFVRNWVLDIGNFGNHFLAFKVYDRRCGYKKVGRI